MVKLCPRLALVLLGLLSAGWAGAQDSGSSDAKGPVLYGDGGGRVWKWTGGEKTWLTAEGRNLVLGGVGEDEAWGWSVEGDKARFFTLALPKKKDPKGSPDAKGSPDEKAVPPALPTFEPAVFPVPDRADRMGGRVLLAWGTRDGHPRYEVWKGTELVAARAWDDGRSLYALALGPEGWIVAGRTSAGLPWLDVSGVPVPAPEGWRGRLTVAAWVPEKEDKKKEDPKQDKKAPPVVHPWAAGWGAPGAETPRPLFWGPEGWTQPEPGEDPVPGGVYPLLGSPGDQGNLVLAGWQSDDGTGTLRPWFWDGEAAEVPGGAADGQPQAFSVGGKGGSFLVVRHQTPPWFTQEDGKESLPLEGLDEGDRVVAVEPAKASP